MNLKEFEKLTGDVELAVKHRGFVCSSIGRSFRDYFGHPFNRARKSFEDHMTPDGAYTCSAWLGDNTKGNIPVRLDTFNRWKDIVLKNKEYLKW